MDLPTRENKEQRSPRLPSAELEAALEQLRGIVRAPGMVADVAPRAARGTGDSCHDPARPDLGPTLPGQQQRIERLLIEKVIVSPSDIEVRLRANGIKKLALELRRAVPEELLHDKFAGNEVGPRSGPSVLPSGGAIEINQKRRL